MSLLSRVLDRFTADDGGPTDTFAYLCADCGHRFETPASRMVSVRCPDCGSSDVRATD